MVAILEVRVFHQIKTNFMKYVALILVVTTVWTAYELWRAPLMEETDDGRLVTKRPTRKLSDLWKKYK